MKALFPFFSLYRTHWGRLLLGIVLAIVGLSASIGLLSLSGWFLAASFLAGSVVVFNFFYPSSGVRGLAVGRTIARYFEKLVTHDATFRVLANLRVSIFKRLIPLSPSGLSRFRNSELLNRLVADVDTLDTLYLNLISPFISALMLIIFMAIGLSFISGTITAIVCLTLLTLLILFPIIFYRLGKGLGKNAVEARAAYRSRFVEWIQLNAEFELFGVSRQAITRLEQIEQEWLATQQKENQLSGLANAVLMLINGILVISVIYLSSTAIQLTEGNHSEALVALLVFCVLASAEILTPIGSAFLHLGQVITAAERLTEITEQPAQVQFLKDETWREVSLGQPLIQFDNVHFSYPERDLAVLNGVSLSLSAGQKVAILGKTGSGKSTLFQLLNRHYEPTSGQIWLNYCKLSDYAEATLRTKLITLSQRVHIFNSTLKENLLMGNRNATDEQLEMVLKQVGLDYLFSDGGLDLWLGEGGRPLSGGEQRRLGLARLLLSSAEIVLLDEPTEGLDRDTEQHILSLILSHCKDKTLLMITHRTQGLAHFDEVYQLDNGILSKR